MDLLYDSTVRYAVAGSIIALFAFLLFQPGNDMVRWLQKKNYQYEVTFSLYMLTPTEKFVFSTLSRPITTIANRLLTERR
jgi:hypothetical protein